MNSIISLLCDPVLAVMPKFLKLPANYYCHKISGKLEKEFALLEQLIPKNGRAIDIGANSGLYTYALAKLCDVVEAFEPQPWLVEILQAYSKKISPKINVHGCALSDSDGNLPLRIPIFRGRIRTALATGLASLNTIEGCEYKTINVDLRKLDSYDFKNVVFIKIDVEGHELHVIEGARRTILREKPVLLIEIEQRHHKNKSINDIFEAITLLGYSGTFLDKGRTCTLKEFSYDIHQKSSLHNIYSKDYVTNFIFRPLPH